MGTGIRHVSAGTLEAWVPGVGRILGAQGRAGSASRGCKKNRVPSEGPGAWRRSFWGKGWESAGRGPGNGQGWRRDEGSWSMGSLGRGRSQERRKNAGGSLGKRGPGADGTLPPSRQLRPGSPDGPPAQSATSPDPLRVPTSAQSPLALSPGNFRGLQATSAACKGVSQTPAGSGLEARRTDTGGPAGTLTEVPTLDEMLSRHPSTLSFRPTAVLNGNCAERRPDPLSLTI